MSKKDIFNNLIELLEGHTAREIATYIANYYDSSTLQEFYEWLAKEQGIDLTTDEDEPEES